MFGPDLSSVASERTATEIRIALLDPSAHIAAGYESVTLHLRSGQTLHGFARSEGNFEITLQDGEGNFIGFCKIRFFRYAKTRSRPCRR